MRDRENTRTRLSLSEYHKGLLDSDKVILGRAITLIESTLDMDLEMANELLQAVLPVTRSTIRIGITGPPGVGKSTFIESLGQHLTSLSKRVAILSIDPSSQRTKGSILGDKTRMDALTRDNNAFIRPTASGATLGGVHDKTREAILLCEAAGFDVIIVETVGVGQSEIHVRSMVDFFALLLLSGAGDELQGIKKGIMEIADEIIITKSDGENVKRTREAQLSCQRALHLFPIPESGLMPNVLLSSAFDHIGIEETWNSIENFWKHTMENGFFEVQRSRQTEEWFHAAIDTALRHEVLRLPSLKADMQQLGKQVLEGTLIPPQASRKLVKKFTHLLSKAMGNI